jgi:hypothetical protein
MDIEIYQKFKTLGIELFNSGKFEEAIDKFLQLTESNQEDFEVLSLLGDAYVATNRKDQAIDFYSKALAINPTDTSSLLKYSKVLLAGLHYIEALKNIHLHIQPKRYIEIGVCRGVSFYLTDKKTIAVGIDPEPQLDIDNLPDNHKVIADTSDNYFKSGRIINDFDGQSFDMAFVDGMHLFEFALRDFINLEKHSNSDSVIFIHDLYPMNAETADRERLADFWSGDVWKLVLCLQEYRPDLDFSVLPCPPTGLGVISGLDSSSTILKDHYDKIVEKYIDYPFSRIEHDRQAKLKLADTDHLWLAIHRKF